MITAILNKLPRRLCYLDFTWSNCNSYFGLSLPSTPHVLYQGLYFEGLYNIHTWPQSPLIFCMKFSWYITQTLTFLISICFSFLNLFCFSVLNQQPKFFFKKRYCITPFFSIASPTVSSIGWKQNTNMSLLTCKAQLSPAFLHVLFYEHSVPLFSLRLTFFFLIVYIILTLSRAFESNVLWF